MSRGAADEENSLRVLVVDDNADIANALSALLELQGCQVRVANQGEDGLELAGSFDPDVIFLDIGLPGIDGYQVARQLRQSSRDHKPVLVALTGYGQASDRERSAEAGFDHHLVKPARLNQIREILDAI